MENKHNENFVICKEDELSSNSCYTLLSALHCMMVASTESHMDRDFYRFDRHTDGELDYITSRLGISEDEAVLFAILCEKGARQSVQLYDIGFHVGCSNLEMLRYKPVFASLVERGLIVEEPVNKYFVPDEVLAAISRNEPWQNGVRVYTSDGDLYRDIFERFVLASGNRISKVAMYKAVHRLLEENIHLHFAKRMVRYRKMLDLDEFMFLLSLSCLWLVKGAQWSQFRKAAMVLRDNVSINKVRTNLLNGSSPLLLKGIVAPYTAESFANNQGFQLTDATKRDLTPESLLFDDPLEYLMRGMVDSEPSQGNTESNAQLIYPNSIEKRPLFYNSATAHQVEELATLLNEKKMRSVLRRLKRSGLRCGFTCIFHGGPGTGKTETVLQLARRTGRAVFQVDVSQLRTKWHGESERLVKGVFDDYCRAVARLEVAPIMLFNEADAIFNCRIENPEHSADKCENAIQNIILQELETFNGILIATTNLATNLDKAFERRFLYKVEFEAPDTDTRAKIWRSMMPSLNSEKARILAEQFPRLVGGHIENITRKATINRVLHGRSTGWEELTEMCCQEMMESRTNHIVGFRAMSY